jgi:hypothetical protein
VGDGAAELVEAPGEVEDGGEGGDGNFGALGGVGNHRHFGNARHAGRLGYARREGIGRIIHHGGHGGHGGRVYIGILNARTRRWKEKGEIARVDGVGEAEEGFSDGDELVLGLDGLGEGAHVGALGVVVVGDEAVEAALGGIEEDGGAGKIGKEGGLPRLRPAVALALARRRGFGGQGSGGCGIGLRFRLRFRL